MDRKWIEEKDYSTYPKEKWCDYDYMAAWIREKGYAPKTSMENLIEIILLSFDETHNIKAIQDFVEYSGGLEEFDYYC